MSSAISAADHPKAAVRWPILLLIVALFLAAVADGIRQSHWKAIHNPNDFVTLYAGSICLTRACNPYSVPDLESTLVHARGTEVRQDWSDQLPIYPPSTLFLLLPFSPLSYSAASTLWYTISLAVYAFGLAWLYFVSPQRLQSPWYARLFAVLLGVHFPKMLQCLGFGNPSLLVTGLLLFAVFDDGEQRRTLRLAAALVASLLKPPLAIPLAALFLLREPAHLRRAWRPAVVLVALFAISAVAAWAIPSSHTWPADLRANLALGQLHGMNPSLRGAASNVILNLANLPGYFTTNTALIAWLSRVAFLALAAVFLAALRRLYRTPQWPTSGYLVSVAALSALTLLPVYHRFCDIGILLLSVPWVLFDCAHRRRPWHAWLAIPMLLALYISWERRIPIYRFHGASHSFVQFLYYRGDALIVALLTGLLLSAMWSSATTTTELKPA